MARLEAIKRALYFPSPERVVNLIGNTIPVVGPGRILDICAGEGVVSHLGDRWGLETYGVELHEERANTCKQKMTKALHGSYHQLRATDKAFSALFLNPPYDYGSEGEDAHIRQEVEFYIDSLQYLAPHGVMIFIPPVHILKNYRFTESFVRKFYNIKVFRFPDPEYDAFKQIIVVGQKRDESGRTDYNSWHSYMPYAPYPILGAEDNDPYVLSTLPCIPEKIQFYLRGENPYDEAPGTTGGVYRIAKWRLLVGENDICTFERPLLAPRPGHIAMLMAAGCLNGTEISGNRIVKGSSEKTTTEGVDEQAELEFSREKIVSRLAVLDLTTGDSETWRTDENPDETKAWFEEHGATLAAAVRRDHPPISEGKWDEKDFETVTAPGILPGYDKPTVLDAQKRVAAAVVTCWRDKKSAIVSGEMGTGKTAISIAAATIYGFKKVVVVCPTHLVRKWLREVDTITKTKGCALTATKLADVDKFFADPTAKFLILSKERAKLGSRWEPATIIKKVKESSETIDGPFTRIIEAAACPDCYAVIVDRDGFPVDRKWLEKDKRSCAVCKGALWQSIPISSKGTKRWPLAHWINHHYPYRYSLIIDEMHQHSRTSDQGQAVQRLAACCNKLLAMTGTLYGGRASSIFHLLYRIDPQFRQLYEYSECAKFVQDHGLLETIHKLDQKTSRYGYRKNNSGGRVREMPGVNPAMINLLLSYTVFIKLADLGYVLPPFEEQVVQIDHDPRVTAEARQLARNVKAVLRKYPKVLGQYLMACLGYPDCPEHAEHIIATESWGEEIEIASAPAFPTQIWPKDEKVLEICLAEREKGLKTLVFFTQTGKRTPIPRVKEHLENMGLKVLILEASVPPEEREEWLAEKVGSFDVLLTNGRLVETGLDLLFANTIVQYSSEYCVTPETRILTDTLIWKPAGDLMVGERLIGFDEEPKSAAHRRRTQPCIVTANARILQEVYKITLLDGTVLRASAEHPWLTILNPGRLVLEWKTTKEMADILDPNWRPAHGRKVKGCWLPRFFTPWQAATNFDAGYLSGMFDGEGFVSLKSKEWEKTKRGISNTVIGFAQRPGLVLEKVKNLLGKYGFSYGAAQQTEADGINLVLRGALSERLRFLGEIRPIRLLDKFTTGFREGRVTQKFKIIDLPQVVKMDYEGLQEVVGLSTSTKTYFAEGFGAHNSINTLRQSTRRSWRLGQTKPVKVIYLAYRDTMQDIAMTLISKKMRAAELVDGDDLGGLSQHDDSGHDLLLELARRAAEDG